MASGSSNSVLARRRADRGRATDAAISPVASPGCRRARPRPGCPAHRRPPRTGGGPSGPRTRPSTTRRTATCRRRRPAPRRPGRPGPWSHRSSSTKARRPSACGRGSAVREHVPERQALAGRGRQLDRRRTDGGSPVEIVGGRGGSGGRARHECPWSRTWSSRAASVRCSTSRPGWRERTVRWPAPCPCRPGSRSSRC